MTHRRIRLPSFAGVPDGPPGRLIAETVLQEIAKAIEELGGKSIPSRNLEPEIQAAPKLFRQRVSLVHGSISDDRCRLAATLLIDGMRVALKIGGGKL